MTTRRLSDGPNVGETWDGDAPPVTPGSESSRARKRSSPAGGASRSFAPPAPAPPVPLSPLSPSPLSSSSSSPPSPPPLSSSSSSSSSSSVSMLSDDEIRSVFDALDVNNNGVLNRDELAGGLNLLGLRHSSEGLWEAISKHDEDMTDGGITWEEFKAFARYRERKLLKLFTRIDQNKDGTVHEDEIIAALESYGVEGERHRKVVRAVLHQTDQRFGDGDGRVSFEEFRTMSLLLPSHRLEDIIHHANESILFGSENEQYGIPKDDRKTFSRHPMAIFLSGALAGFVSRTATAPADRVKVLMQAGNRGSSGSSASIRATAAKIYKEGGLQSFWRGNGANVVKIMPESAFKFYFNDFFKARIVADPDNVAQHERLVAGSLAGIASQSTIYPMEMVKTRLAVSEAGTYAGIVDCARSIVRTEGAGALYKGLAASNIGIIPYAGVDLGMYGMLKEHFRKRHPDTEPKWYEFFAIGCVSSFSGVTVAYPLQLIRTKLQSSGLPGRPAYSGLLHVVNDVLQRDGIRGFYRGIGATFCKAIPASAIGYVGFEGASKALGPLFEDGD